LVDLRLRERQRLRILARGFVCQPEIFSRKDSSGEGLAQLINLCPDCIEHLSFGRLQLFVRCGCSKFALTAALDNLIVAERVNRVCACIRIRIPEPWNAPGNR
jgi:hypothetical protein